MHTTTSTYDCFISHASEDKDEFVRPLAHALTTKGLTVWFDEFALTVGDSLRQSIDHGLAQSRFGVVVVSPHFLKKDWPQRELSGLIAKEIGRSKAVLPVWHNVNRDDVLAVSPTLVDEWATHSAKGLDAVVTDLLRAIHATNTPLELPPEPVAPAVPITGPGAHVFPLGVLAQINPKRAVEQGDTAILLNDAPHLFIRVIPSRPGQRMDSTKLRDAMMSSHLHTPLSYKIPGPCWTNCNRHGVAAFTVTPNPDLSSP